MPDTQKVPGAVPRAAQRVKRAEAELADARQSLYEAVRRANAAGVSLSAISRALGVSRQAVQKMIRR